MKNIILILLSIVSLKIYGQNYVPNFSFEQRTACAIQNRVPLDLPDEVQKAPGWKSYLYSPDIFDDCDTISFYPSVEVPANFAGYQLAYEGNKYAGFQSRTFTINDNQEFYEVLGCALLSPLVIGETYEISFRISLADVSNKAINNIGIIFLNEDFDAVSRPFVRRNYAHLLSPDIIIDTLNWTEVSGTFTADSAYSYFAIGNVVASDSVVYGLLNPDTLYTAAYNYLDYVCVTPLGGQCEVPVSINQLHISPSFAAFPNPLIKSQSSILHFSKESNVEVYDLVGQKVGYYENVMEIDAGTWAAGVYFLKEKGGGVTKVVVME